MQKKQRQAYNIPSLSPKDIIRYLTEVDIPVRQSDILKPTIIFVSRLYESIINIYTCEGISGALLSEIDCGDSIDSLYLIMIYRKMHGFMTSIGMANFCFKDLYPDNQRIITILSYVVNFSMFRDSKRSVCERMLKVSDEKQVLQRDIEDRVQKAEREYSKCKKEAEGYSMRREEIKREIRELDDELKEFVKIQRALVQETEQLKAQREECNDRLSSAQLVVMNLRQEIACLKTQIVSDPTKLIDLLEEMRELLRKEDSSLKESQNINTILQERIEYFKGTKNEIYDLLKNAERLKESMSDIEKLTKLTGEIEVEIRHVNSGISTMKIRLDHIQRQISHLESKLATLQDIDKKSSVEISNKMGILKEDYEKISGYRNEIRNKIDANIKETRELEHQIIILKNEYENEVSDIMSALNRVKNKESEFFSHVTDIL